jgi:hypothetical protein
MPNESLLQLPKLFFESVCHAGLDPESIAVSTSYVSGCRIKSGMTRSSFLQKL